MIRRQSFDAPTREEAEALAESWIKSHPGCRVISSKAIHASTLQRGVPIGVGGSWTLVLEYDDQPTPA